MAKITTIGMFKLNPELFVGLHIPEQIDLETLINNILRETGNLEVFYPDADFFQSAIGYWSAARLDTWKRMAAVLYEDYEPFINIKRDEVRTVVQERDLQTTANTSDGVTAWNSSDSVERSRQTGSSADTGTVSTTEHFHVEGDSAITDAQDVVRNEMEVRKDFNLYNIITNEFKKEFCLLVY